MRKVLLLKFRKVRELYTRIKNWSEFIQFRSRGAQERMMAIGCLQSQRSIFVPEHLGNTQSWHGQQDALCKKTNFLLEWHCVMLEHNQPDLLLCEIIPELDMFFMFKRGFNMGYFIVGIYIYIYTLQTECIVYSLQNILSRVCSTTFVSTLKRKVKV